MWGYDTQKHTVYEALITADTDEIISDLEDYKSACAGGDLEQYDKIQKLLDDVLQFEKNVDSHYVKRFDPQFTSYMAEPEIMGDEDGRSERIESLRCRPVRAVMTTPC